MDVDDSDIVSQDDHEHARNVKFRKTGNLSHAALDEICDFATEVKAKAEELGRRHSKSPCDILVAAGLTNRNMVNNIITAEYNQLMKDIPKDDTAARKEKLKAVYEWSESSSAVPANKSVKSIAVRVHNVKTQFSGLAEVWSTLEDIEIAGVVMYVGQDPAGRQTSGIFGGSDIIRKYINDPDALCQLGVPYLQRKLGSMYDGQSDDDDDDEKNDCLDGVPEVEIKPWNEDVISIRDVHPLKGEIALVKAPDGMVLRKVSDNPEWQKSCKEEDPGMAAHHAQSGIPFPSCKQPHVEVTDNDTVPREVSQSTQPLLSTNAPQGFTL
ncbi:hypothetical protein M404DRAFT_145884 [Pisolithus tinctorius Marx 270]|uniref:Uncharacterized protein n=1 Tax=Pisolithus tinctorius Marx 270 TaxID=870435 RepID=A0A0C3K183_PISTI|nr:hypothetical protein M404DRAFT_145884 [Pisolithus tinctorius Marx 270]